MQQILVTYNGNSAWATPEQAQTLAMLANTRGGGFAVVHDYVATSGRTEPEVYDATLLTRFSYRKLVARKIEAIKALTADDIFERMWDEPKLRGFGISRFIAEFEARRKRELENLAGTSLELSSVVQREAHQRCYLFVAEGVNVHLRTAPDDRGYMQPELGDQGFPIVDSIMLNCIELSRRVSKPGVYKKVNSGMPVLISNAINAELKARGVRSMQRLSLAPGKFSGLSIDNSTILPDDCKQLQD